MYKHFRTGVTMINYIILASVWIIALVCWRIMKKIEPEIATAYLVYVLIISILITVFGVNYLSQV